MEESESDAECSNSKQEKDSDQTRQKEELLPKKLNKTTSVIWMTCGYKKSDMDQNSVFSQLAML